MASDMTLHGQSASPNMEALYRALRRAEPGAVAYYEGLKKKIEDGKRAELVVRGLQALHHQYTFQAGAYIGADSSPHVTPNGRLLTKEAMSQLVAACYAAANR